MSHSCFCHEKKSVCVSESSRSQQPCGWMVLASRQESWWVCSSVEAVGGAVPQQVWVQLEYRPGNWHTWVPRLLSFGDLRAQTGREAVLRVGHRCPWSVRNSVPSLFWHLNNGQAAARREKLFTGVQTIYSDGNLRIFGWQISAFKWAILCSWTTSPDTFPLYTTPNPYRLAHVAPRMFDLSC